MKYEYIERSFNRLLTEGFVPFFKKRGFEIKKNHFSRKLDDVTHLFHVRTFMKKRKTGLKNMVIQPQFGFHNSEISQLIWPGEKNKKVAKMGNCFLEYDMGVFSGNTFYTISEKDTEKSINKLIKTVATELERTLAPIFDKYMNLCDLYLFLDNKHKHPSVDKIYAKYQKENVFETSFNLFLKGLSSFLIYTGEKELAAQVLKRAYYKIMTPQQINKVALSPNGKYIDNYTLGIVDAYKDLPFIERLNKEHGFRIE